MGSLLVYFCVPICFISLAYESVFMQTPCFILFDSVIETWYYESSSVSVFTQDFLTNCYPSLSLPIIGLFSLPLPRPSLIF